MRKIGIISILFLLSFFVFAEDEKELLEIESEKSNDYGDFIQIRSVIYPSSELELYTDENGENFIWSIERKPKYSNVTINGIGRSVTIKFDLAGEYIINLKSDDNLSKKIINVEKNYLSGEYELFEKIERVYDIEDLDYLIKLTEEFFVNFSNSEKLFEIYDLVASLSFKKRSNGAEKFLIDLLKYDKNIQSKQEERLYRLYMLSKENGELLKAKKYIDKLFLENSFTYKKEYAKFYFENIDKNYGLSLMEKMYEKKYDREINTILGEYYREKNIKKSELFYKDDKMELAKIYIEEKDKKKTRELIEEFNEKELEVFKELSNEIINGKKSDEYYARAIDNYKSGNYEEALIYYDKVLLGSKDEMKIKKSYFNTAKIYFLKQDYVKSIKQFNKYNELYGTVKDVEAKYYMAIIYFNMEDYEKSKKLFSLILEKYPYTIWETKSKIYILKIKNKGELDEYTGSKSNYQTENGKDTRVEGDGA